MENTSKMENPGLDGLTAEQSSLLSPLIRQDAWQDFQSSFEQVIGFWSTLVLDTSLPGAATSMPEVETVLLKLDNVITDQTTLYWKRRLAYQQLARVATSFEQILNSGGHINRLLGYRRVHPSVVLTDAYVRALGGRISRNDVRLRIRWAKRQSTLFGGSLFLLFAYSDRAETKM